MTLPIEFPTFNWFKHNLGDCPSLAGFCDHAVCCGVVVERYTPKGTATCDEHYEDIQRKETA